jgi:hypothetical protein
LGGGFAGAGGEIAAGGAPQGTGEERLPWPLSKNLRRAI